MNRRTQMVPAMVALMLVNQLPVEAAPSVEDLSYANLTEGKGDVYKRGFTDVNREIWSNPERAKVGDKLFEGMQLGTGDKSWAQLAWRYITTRAWANSVYAIAPSQKLVYLVGGEMLFQLDKNRKDHSEYYVWTNLLQARIRGTTVLVQATGNTSKISVLEGTIDVMNRSDHSIVRIKPGVVYEVKSKDAVGAAPNGGGVEAIMGKTYMSGAQTTMQTNLSAAGSRNISAGAGINGSATPGSSATSTPSATSATPSTSNTVASAGVATGGLIGNVVGGTTGQGIGIANGAVSLVDGLTGGTLNGLTKTLGGTLNSVDGTLNKTLGTVDGTLNKLTGTTLGLANGTLGAVDKLTSGLTGGTLTGVTSSLTGSTGVLGGLTGGTSGGLGGLTSGLTGGTSGGLGGLTSGLTGGTSGGLGGLTSGLTGGTSGGLGGLTSGLNGRVSSANLVNESPESTNMISSTTAGTPLFETAKTVTTIFPADPKQLLASPLLTHFDAPLQSASLINDALSNVETPTKVVASAAQVMRVPVLLSYNIGSTVTNTFNLPAGSVSNWPPTAYINNGSNANAPSNTIVQNLAAERNAAGKLLFSSSSLNPENPTQQIGISDVVMGPQIATSSAVNAANIVNGTAVGLGGSLSNELLGSASSSRSLLSSVTGIVSGAPGALGSSGTSGITIPGVGGSSPILTIGSGGGSGGGIIPPITIGGGGGGIIPPITIGGGGGGIIPPITIGGGGGGIIPPITIGGGGGGGIIPPITIGGGGGGGIIPPITIGGGGGGGIIPPITIGGGGGGGITLPLGVLSTTNSSMTKTTTTVTNVLPTLPTLPGGTHVNLTSAVGGVLQGRHGR